MDILYNILNNNIDDCNNDNYNNNNNNNANIIDGEVGNWVAERVAGWQVGYTIK